MAYTKYSLTPANNTSAPPDGAPEGMLPSAVNDTMRDMMAQIRDCGDGVRDGTYTMTAPKITGGTITGVTLTGNTFSSPIVSGGTINNATIGATTATTGKFTSVTNTGLTSGRVTYAGASGLLSDSASFTYNGTNLSVNGATITGGGAQIAGGAWSIVPYVFNSLTIDNSGGAARFFATGADASTYGSYIWYGGLTTGTTSQYMELNTSGGLKTLNTIGVGNATPSTSGAGITFPATQSASSNANTLDDYEEGTWTPGYTNWLVDPTVSSTAKYTKIGRLVTVSVYLTGGTTQAGSQISGLPFTCDTEASMISTNGTTSSLVFYGVVLGSNTVIGSLSAQTLTSTFYAVTATYFTT